ncbi:protein TPX2-like isoform X2 [Alnus glutinosa]|uniref:protein TPX2-like isoform X2 n=1 Tax=Alnus glutinosa TaxID=3517 RepID=UPI002D77B987|nr:protein TPX2-like isoform X2 [Alnus glutinosa]
MDDDMDEFVVEPFVAEEIDLDYEFDVPRFYDFTWPETDLEAREAERWFESAQSYPPSPFIVKLKWPKEVPIENSSTYAKPRNDANMDSIGNYSDSCMCSEVSATDDSNKGYYNQMAPASPKAKTKSPVKSTLARSSTLMKPTASNLAKQNKPREIHSTRFLRRFQNKLENIDEKSSRSAYVIDCQATKRQKLGAGYLKKVSHLKHQALLQHKLPKKVETIDVNSVVHSRPEVTIPREPNLATARRAQRDRSKIKTESGQHAQSNAYNYCFKARPLNRKILQAPSLPLPKKSIPQLQEIQVFHLKTSERAMQHTSSNAGNTSKFNSISQSATVDSKSLNCSDALRRNCKTVNKFKARPLYTKILSSKGEIGIFQNSKQETTVPREFNFLTDKTFPEPPIELLSKLSLASDSHPNVKSQSKMYLPTKVAKENTPGPFHQARVC